MATPVLPSLPPDLWGIVLSYVGDEECAPVRALAGDAQDVSVTTCARGIVRTRVNGRFHSVRDQPAIVSPSGARSWYRNGKLHRDGDKPAVVSADGSQSWYRNGRWHRDGDQPALIFSSGTRMWYRDDRLHRDGDEPAIVYADGRREWWRNGRLHRDGGEPAVLGADGKYEWWRDGLRMPAPRRCSRHKRPRTTSPGAGSVQTKLRFN